MATNRIDVFQSLTVAAVRHDHTRVHVDVLGRHGERDQVTFEFSEARVAADHCWTVRRWQERGTSLTYVRRGGEGVLLDDEEGFRRSLGDDLAC